MNFLDYLANIAPEGETILFVRQKPAKPEQFHMDGAMKCSWPAYLPDKWKADQAWYCNTGCFIIDRFEAGRPSARADNCERVAFLVLDDVGTKAKVPSIAPTWIMETSPNNYQYGYTFSLDDQPMKGDFSAAIVAIAAIGASSLSTLYSALMRDREMQIETMLAMGENLVKHYHGLSRKGEPTRALF